MDLFNTLATTLYPSTITEQTIYMSNHYKEERDERIADSVYEIVDNLSEDAIRRLLEEHLIESAIDDESFAWELMHTPGVFMRQAETKAGHYHKG